MDGDEVFVVADAGPDGRVAVLEAVAQVVDVEAGDGGIDPQVEAVGVVADDVVDELGAEAGDAGARAEDGAAAAFRVGQAVLVVHGHPVADGGDRADHLLAVNLLGAADTAHPPALVAGKGLQADLADHFLGA